MTSLKLVYKVEELTRAGCSIAVFFLCCICLFSDLETVVLISSLAFF